jgi:hypothetical protein
MELTVIVCLLSYCGAHPQKRINLSRKEKKNKNEEEQENH